MLRSEARINPFYLAPSFAAADAAGGEPVAHAHVATGDGEAFCVREGPYVAVAVTERFTLSSLMIFDIRIALRQLAAAGAAT